MQQLRVVPLECKKSHCCYCREQLNIPSDKYAIHKKFGSSAGSHLVHCMHLFTKTCSEYKANYNWSHEKLKHNPPNSMENNKRKRKEKLCSTKMCVWSVYTSPKNQSTRNHYAFVCWRCPNKSKFHLRDWERNATARHSSKGRAKCSGTPIEANWFFVRVSKVRQLCLWKS